MDRKKLDKLWRDLEDARRSPQTAAELESLAKMAERSTRMGKHVMWVSPLGRSPKRDRAQARWERRSVMKVADILKMPYSRVVVPDESGTFTAEIFEFPGCIAVGATAAEALANLEEVTSDWVSTALEQGQDIPEP